MVAVEAWQDLGGVAMQFDDEEFEIQVVGAGNPDWRQPSWVLEAWCKKDGCRNNHYVGSIPVDTELEQIVTLCKDNHKVCRKTRSKNRKKK